jgi:antitoxin HicB
MDKNIEYYMRLPYKVEIVPEPDNSGYTAIIPTLPGCMTSADTMEELWPMLDEAKELWFEVALDDGEYIPEPAPYEEEEYSGKFVLRIPKSLHRQLAIRAEREETSLNQLVVMILSDGMGKWSVTKSQFKEYTKFFRNYTTYAQFNLSSLLKQFQDTLLQDTSEEEETIGWDVESLFTTVNKGTRIDIHG